MRIGVLGDSHGIIKNVNNAMRMLKNAELVIFTGDYIGDIKHLEGEYDGDVIAIRGNCDSIGEHEVVKTILGQRFFICHGHKYGVKYTLDNLYYRAQELKADVVIFGHTHIPYYEETNGIIMINPGSVTLPRGRSKKSCVRIDLGEKIEVEFLEVK
ncbi:MAG: metallophosphoesterase [Clostridiales bacterium]|nr:metallophosphoesterase [Clostridiales bacterium]